MKNPFRDRSIDALYGGRVGHAWLVCPGPSLAQMDLSMLAAPGVVTMGINRTPYTFRTTHFTMCDSWTTYPKWVWYDPTVVKFVRTRHADLLASFANTYHTSWSREMPPEAFFSGDRIPQGLAGSRTASTMFAAASILVRLGATRVNVIGADFHMPEAGPCYCNGFQRTAQEIQRYPGHFATISRMFAQVAELAPAHGVELFNCTPGGAFDGLTRLAFDRAVVEAEVDRRQRLEVTDGDN